MVTQLESAGIRMCLHTCNSFWRPIWFHRRQRLKRSKAFRGKSPYLSFALASMPIVVYTKEALMIDGMMFDFASSNIKPPPMMMDSTIPDLEFSQAVAANHAQITDAQSNKALLMTHKFKDIAHVNRVFR